MLSNRERKIKERARRKVRGRPPLPAALFFRIFVIGSISIVAAGYAIYRHYYVARPPMLVPAPAETERPAPSLEFLTFPPSDDAGPSP